MTPPSDLPPQAPEPPDDPRDQPLPLQLELPGGRAESRPPEPGRPAVGGGSSRRSRVGWSVVVGLLLLGGGAAAIAAWALPWYLEHRSIEAAAEHGITLGIARVEAVPGGFRLFGVRATSSLLPGAVAEAPEIDVGTAGLRARDVIVRGGELSLRGSYAVVAAEFARLQQSLSRGEDAWEPASLAIVGARVTWQGPIGDTMQAEATDVHAKFAWSAAEDGEPGQAGPGRAGPSETHLRSDHVVFEPAAGPMLGPWRVDVDRAVGSSRLRVALDPDVPETCSLLVVGDGDRTTSVDISVPRAPVAHLGLPVSSLGWDGERVQVEGTVHYAPLGTARADLTAKGGIYGFSLPWVPLPVDATWEGAARGDPSTGIDVKSAHLAVGPFAGAVKGTVKTFDDGFRLNLAWTGGPVACSNLSTPLDIAGDASSASAANHPRRADTASASITLSFDSRDLGATKVEFKPEIDCIRPRASVARGER